jgi:GYF domain 2
MNMKKYFIHDGNKEVGPFSLNELKEKKIAVDTPIWYEGTENWLIAKDIEELSDLFKIKSIIPPPYNQKIENPIVNSPNNQTTVNTSENTNSITSEPKINDKEIIAKAIRQGNVTAKKPKRKLWLWVGLVALLIIIITLVPKIERENNRSNFSRDPKSYVSVSNDGYKFNEILGGIEDLKLTVHNSSDFGINNAKILVSYIRKNGNVYKQEFVETGYINEHSSESFSAPNSDAGVSVTLEVYNVTSSEMR